MNTFVSCPACGRHLELPPGLAGKTGVCDKCGHAFQIPPDPAATPAPRPAPRPVAPPTRPPAAPVSPGGQEARSSGDQADQGPATDPRWDYRLLGTDAFVIRDDGGVLNYLILDARTGHDVGLAREVGVPEASGPDRASRPCSVRVYDTWTDARVLAFYRDGFRTPAGFNPVRVDVGDADGRPIGWFEATAVPSEGRFPVYDRTGREVAVVDGRWGPEPDYFIDADGQRVGRGTGEGEVRRFYPGVTFSWCGRGGDLLLRLRGRPAEDPELKALVLGTAVALESLLGSIKTRTR